MARTLLTTPPLLGRFLHSRAGFPLARRLPVSFIGSDPAGARLGSGGGTAHLLHSAWLAARTERRPSFEEWIEQESSLVLHAGGESRRLPAYAAIGKSFVPIPAGIGGQRRFDQVLSDFQLPAYTRVLKEAGEHARVLVASGDVWLEFDPLQISPVSADITGLGMAVAPEVAKDFGVFFSPKAVLPAPGSTRKVSLFLQKPLPREIYAELSRNDFFVDTGLWLLSARAVGVLMKRCGWSVRDQRFKTENGLPLAMDLYSEFGCSLGAGAAVPRRLGRAGWTGLTSGVITLEQARFFHPGSTRQLLETFEKLVRTPAQSAKVLTARTDRRPEKEPKSGPVWLERVASRKLIFVDGWNAVTGLPMGAGDIRLEREQCLDVVPYGSRKFVVRPYLVDDTLKGEVSTGATIAGQAASAWLAARGWRPKGGDIFRTPIYPVLEAKEIGQELLDWFFSKAPDQAFSRRWLARERLSAAEIGDKVALERLFKEQHRGAEAALRQEFERCLREGDSRVMEQDFSRLGDFCRDQARGLGLWILRHHQELLRRLSGPEHQARLLALVAQIGPRRARERVMRKAFQTLQSRLVSSSLLDPVRPILSLKEDQIVWARSPARLDLAGGWTDTPPYCLERGGTVLNVAVLLNGQPPIQAFIRPLKEPKFILRSIDLGAVEEVTSFRQLAGFRDPKSGFSLPKAALALAGFLPEFSNQRGHRTLAGYLRSFGTGLELSLLSAVPKGSGLGTSSILGATLLGALNRACQLGWDEVSLYRRVLALEQLLTTGGGWQDQAGALFRGLKLVETVSGPSQIPTVRFLPTHLLENDHANRSLLLYYTGITRLAKGILKEIVESMFLGRFETLQTLDVIRDNAVRLFLAIQRGDRPTFERCVGRSWTLNKELDSGTSTPEIENILQTAGPGVKSAKLLGAGGGGYMLFCAQNSVAGAQIRANLERNPPNPRARFIDFEVATKGLEVTVS